MAVCSGLVSQYQKGKTTLDLLKQETVSGSGICWVKCKSAPHSRQITMPAPHHSVFLQAGYPSNVIKALNGKCLLRYRDAFNIQYTIVQVHEPQIK